MNKMISFYIISGALGAAAFYAGLTGRKLLFISSPRTAVIILTVVGILMCSRGCVGLFVTRALAHPLTIAGCVLGSLALFAGIVQVFRLKVPLVSDPHNALILIGAVIIIKFVMARFSFLLPLK